MSQHTWEWWETLRACFDGDVWSSSGDGRTDRDETAVRELLRYLGIAFTAEELGVPSRDDDVDVRFRGARFQNVERMEGRELAERARTAESDRGLAVPRSESVPMSVRELVREVLKALDGKSRRTASRGSLDALVHLTLRGRYLHPASDVIEDDTSAVAQLGWRSVSVLWPPYAVVLCATPAAPKFLRLKVGRIVRCSGIPWEEDGAVTGEAAALVHLAGAAVSGLAAAGYIALGALVLATRGARDATGALRARLAHEGVAGIRG